MNCFLLKNFVAQLRVIPIVADWLLKIETAYVLHVSNLHPKTTSRDLEDDVRKLVTPRTVRVIMDLETRAPYLTSPLFISHHILQCEFLELSRGFGFIYLNSEEDMRKVMEELKTVDGKHVKVQQAPSSSDLLSLRSFLAPHFLSTPS